MGLSVQNWPSWGDQPSQTLFEKLPGNGGAGKMAGRKNERVGEREMAGLMNGARCWKTADCAVKGKANGGNILK